MGKGIGAPEWFRIYPNEEANLSRQADKW